ncbi:hypothetical protein DPMN_111425 [Dreissena polymorpha]|uniref:Uncharacterized protein n=1 Tax=Dreissena polymorpha TaxID=45954 RepID=A0A9D4QPW5_DREPO|nr:hypothetical protein DPMN_111425 [Dreissena polymorpha]
MVSVPLLERSLGPPNTPSTGSTQETDSRAFNRRVKAKSGIVDASLCLAQLERRERVSYVVGTTYFPRASKLLPRVS